MIHTISVRYLLLTSLQDRVRLVVIGENPDNILRFTDDLLKEMRSFRISVACGQISMEYLLSQRQVLTTDHIKANDYPSALPISEASLRKGDAPFHERISFTKVESFHNPLGNFGLFRLNLYLTLLFLSRNVLLRTPSCIGRGNICVEFHHIVPLLVSIWQSLELLLYRKSDLPCINREAMDGTSFEGSVIGVLSMILFHIKMTLRVWVRRSRCLPLKPIPQCSMNGEAPSQVHGTSICPRSILCKSFLSGLMEYIIISLLFQMRAESQDDGKEMQNFPRTGQLEYKKQLEPFTMNRKRRKFMSRRILLNQRMLQGFSKLLLLVET